MEGFLKSRYFRGSGNPDYSQPIRKTGFYFPAQVESRLQVNDQNRFSAILYKVIRIKPRMFSGEPCFWEIVHYIKYIRLKIKKINKFNNLVMSDQKY